MVKPDHQPAAQCRLFFWYFGRVGSAHVTLIKQQLVFFGWHLEADGYEINEATMYRFRRIIMQIITWHTFYKYQTTLCFNSRFGKISVWVCGIKKISDTFGNSRWRFYQTYGCLVSNLYLVHIDIRLWLKYNLNSIVFNSIELKLWSWGHITFVFMLLRVNSLYLLNVHVQRSINFCLFCTFITKNAFQQR